MSTAFWDKRGTVETIGGVRYWSVGYSFQCVKFVWSNKVRAQEQPWGDALGPSGETPLEALVWVACRRIHGTYLVTTAKNLLVIIASPMHL
jgi:hypothetical protein